MKILLEERANLFQFPIARTKIATEVTIGDLHGNALTLIYFLLREGVLNLSHEDYKKIISIYTANQLNKNLLNDFKAIVQRAQKTDRNILIRLIGDEVCDRGQNDYFTLIILKKLHLLNQQIEIIFSNHGLAFLDAFENYASENKLYSNYFRGAQYSRSLTNLDNLISTNLITKDEVSDMVNNVYKPLIKPLSYTLDQKDDLILYTHAPSDLRIIKNLALKFNIKFDDLNIEALINTVKGINKRFCFYLLNNKIHTLFDRANFCNPDNFKRNDTAIEDLTWNRNYNELNFKPVHNGFKLSYAYGHDKTEISHPFGNIYGLDNNFGKSFNKLREFEIYKVLLIS